MKHFNHIVLLAALISVTGFSSCKKFLEQPPQNRISLNDIFNDFEGARTTLVGCYENMKSYDYYLRDFYTYSDLAGGNIKYTRTSGSVQTRVFNFANATNSLENDMIRFYQTAYEIIYAANNILTNVDRAADASVFQKNRMLADAYTIRALTHFDLVRIFAQPYNFTADASHPGIIIKTVNGDVLAPAGTPSTTAQVYEQVIKDLDTAIALYGNSVAIYSAGNDKTWLSRDAAKALLSRVCLYKGDWDRAIALTTELITPNTYRLLTSAQYVASWSKKNISTESIFELAFGTRTGGSLGSYYNPAITTTVQWAATNDILNLFATGDIRGKATMFVSGTGTTATFSFTKKYLGAGDSSNNVKLIRSSELYLIRAEAYAEKNSLTLALADLNTIRKRANAAAVNFASTDQQVVINEILTERRRELCFEGSTFFDVARKKKNLVRVDCISANANIPYPDSRFACPIPVFDN